MELLNNSLGCELWLSLCAKLLEALTYLHEEVNILHNDIKLNNVLIAKSEHCVSVALPKSLPSLQFTCK